MYIKSPRAATAKEISMVFIITKIKVDGDDNRYN
jgi:hypothetical protein